MASVTVTTMKRSELAHVQRMLEHKQHAEQLERLIAQGAHFVHRPQLLQLADQELDLSRAPYEAWLKKYDLKEGDNVTINFMTGEVLREVPDDTDGESGNTDDSDATPQSSEFDRIPA